MAKKKAVEVETVLVEDADDRLKLVDALLDAMGKRLKDSVEKVSTADYVRLWGLRDELAKRHEDKGPVEVSWKDQEPAQ